MNRVVVLFALASLVALAQAGAQTVATNPAPGTYHHAIVVSLTPPAAGQQLYYRVAIDGTQQTESPTVRYNIPLFLTALPGRQRTYRITIETREEQRVVQTDQAVWVIDRSVQRPATGLVGSPATHAAAGGAGSESTPTSIPILSPVPGTFGNEQQLYINQKDFRWVRYTLDGSDPTQDGTPYSHPLVIPKTGPVDLKVAALGHGSSHPLTAEVTYTVKQGTDNPFATAGGEAPSPVTLKPPAGGDYYYTLQEQTPDASDIPFDRPLQIGAPPGSLAYTVLRLRSRASDGTWGPGFRYFYAVDRRPAPAPTIGLIGGTIATPRTRVRIDDAPYTKIYYTIDGSSPSTSSPLYSTPFTPALPPESAGTVTIRARAVAPNGTESKTVSVEFPYMTKTPQPPNVALEKPSASVPDTGRLVLVEVPAGSTAVYERTLDGSTPAAPTVNSPGATPEMLLSVPRGTNVLFSLTFATVDATGAISAPTKPLAVRIDALPPAEPTLTFSDGRLTIKGEGTLRYTVTDNGAPPPTPGTGALLYKGPMPLSGSAGARVVYRVAAVSIDSDGLRSTVSRGGPYVVDDRSPAVPVYWGVAPGGIYNDARTLHVETPPGEEVHYTLSTDGRSPDDPSGDSPVFGANMQFSVPEGASKSYVVKLREAVAGRLGPVATIPFTIDRIPPPVPTIEGVGASQVSNHPVTIDPPKAAVGESLYISISTVGDPGDPLGDTGRPFETPILLTATAGQELTYHIRLAARDRAGNSAEGSTVYLVTIDRRLPASPTITATPSGGTAAGEVSVTIAGGSTETYHYEMTDDGSDPPVPTAQSRRYTSPIELKALNGRATLYTLLATAEDAAGNLSATPSVYRVLVTPAAAAPASTPPGGASSGAAGNTSTGAPASAASGAASGSSAATGASGPISPPTELLRGAKNGGLYNAAVTLTSAASEGVVRYELDSNGGAPATVTRFSPELPQGLVLEPAFGGTRHYTIRAALFSSSGSSALLKSELISFTIDRTPPPPPHISGIVDNARYQQAETFSLHAASGTIYYSLDKLTPFVSSGSLSSTKSTEYTKPVTIGKGEASARYRIHAYTLDAAGNRSLKTSEWTVYFDRGVVYVSPAGSDSNDGTSLEPIKTLGRALELAENRQRGTIFLAAGSYALNRSYRVTTGISILGDFDPKDWHQRTAPGKPSTTVSVTLPPSAPPAVPVFSIEGGGLSLENVALRDERGGQLVDLHTGALSVSNSTLESNSVNRAIVEAAGGTRALLHQLEPLLAAEALTVTGKRLGENLEGATVVDEATIRPLERPFSGEPAIVVLRGSLAPDSGIVKRLATGDGDRPTQFRGPARCYDAAEAAVAGIKAGAVRPGEVVVLRGIGPRGTPGMGMASAGVFALDAAGLLGPCALVSDGQQSGLSNLGLVVNEVSPEAAAGGPIGLVEDGDVIAIDVQRRVVDLEVADEELARRRARLAAVAAPASSERGWLSIYRRLVRPLQEGAVLVE